MQKLKRHRDSCSQMFFKTGVLKNLEISHRKTPVSESIFNKVAGLKACNFIKKRLEHRCFPVTIAKFLKIAFLYITPLAATSEGIAQQ